MLEGLYNHDTDVRMVDNAPAPEPENFAALSPLKQTEGYDSKLRRSNQMRFAPIPLSMKPEEVVYTHKYTATVPFQFTSDKKPAEKKTSVYKRN